jgi:hypothetical protein
MSDEINKQIHDLIEKNRSIFEGKPIAFDGLTSEAKYKESSPRAIFLLKEVNAPDKKDDWEFVTHLNYQANPENDPTHRITWLYGTWHNVCRWIEILKRPDITYADCEKINEDTIRRNLNYTGVVNIKKTYGIGSSQWAEINRWACLEENKKLIRDEIALTEAQLVVCGGTFEFAKKIYEGLFSSPQTLPSGAQYFTVNNQCFLEFVHPRWFSVNTRILFAYASVVFKEIKNKL